MKSCPSHKNDALSGTIERVTYHNVDTGFCVLRVKVPSKRELVTVVGMVPDVRIGEDLEAEGFWTQNKHHGLQFQTTQITLATPNSEKGIEKYLASGLIKGIGPHFAKKLVKQFSTNLLHIIDKTPEKLKSLPGIGPKRLKLMLQSWKEHKSIRQTMIFLNEHGIGGTRGLRIYKTYAHQTIECIQANPYCLARDIKGIGFKTADQIAATFNIEKTSMRRARAAVGYLLQESLNAGHCAFPVAQLVEKAQTHLDIPATCVQQAIDLEKDIHTIYPLEIDNTACLALSGLYYQEKYVAAQIQMRTRLCPPWRIRKIEAALHWAQQHSTLVLSAQQKQAIDTCLKSAMSVITGGPGVGKTTLLKTLIMILRAKKVKVVLAAPTGRAAKRMSQSTGMIAQTLHRLLQCDPVSGGFKHNEKMPLTCDVLILDESSMIDVTLMHAILRALPSHAGLILVGDVDQLPSVGPGQVLYDVIASGAVPTLRLTQVFRQATQSRIVVNAHRVNQGCVPSMDTLNLEEKIDFYLVEVDTPEEAQAKIVAIVRDRLPQRFGFHPVSDIQVLCPMNKSLTGTHALNITLQKTLNPTAVQKNVERFGIIYGMGDKVMQTENNYDKNVFNGDVGRIVYIDHNENTLTIQFSQHTCVYAFHELDQVTLAYAMTVHKAQGSEYPAVVMPLMMQHMPMLKRNIVYTGITRGQKMVVLVTQKKALHIAVNAHQKNKRWSKLQHYLT